MPSRTDHDRRDAQHAARATISVAMGRYIRRLTEAAYAHIEEAATNEEDEHDWTRVGALAAHRALSSYELRGFLDGIIEIEAEEAPEDRAELAPGS